MNTSPPQDRRASAGPLARLVALVLLGALAVWLHARSGAYTSNFGAFEDEPAHLVSALMIRDWLAGGDLGSPLSFARDYHLHFPKVAIGQWPPLLHGLLGAWMLVFGTSTVAIAALSTLLVALTAYVVHLVVARAVGDAAGLLAGALYLCTPVVRSTSAAAMTETPIALLALLAILAFGRFVDGGRAAWAFTFAAASALTILTKGSGLALALVPPLALLLASRLDLVRRPALWGAGAAVAALTAPWYALTVGISQGSWAGGATPSWGYVTFAAHSYAGWLPDLTGVTGELLVPVGLAWSLHQPAARGRWAALAAWLPALLLLHLFVPSSVDDRHLAVLAPQWAIFTALGAAALARELGRVLRNRPGVGAPAATRASAVGVAVAVALAAAFTPPAPDKAWSGYEELATELIGLGESVSPRVLVAADPTGEGLVVAGFARHASLGSGRHVIRASKALCGADWSGRDYHARFGTPGEVAAWLDSIGVGVLVLDRTSRGTRHWYLHMRQLDALTQPRMGGGAAAWTELSRRDLVRAGARHDEGAVVYVRRGWEELPLPDLRLEDVVGAVGGGSGWVPRIAQAPDAATSDAP